MFEHNPQFGSKFQKLFHYKSMVRLNSEDFSKFFLCLGILFLTFSYERTHQEVQENAEIFSNILEYS